MTVTLDGQRLEVPDGLTFADLIDYARRQARERSIVELRLNREVVSQAQLDELDDQIAFGDVELISASPRELIAEVARRAQQYLNELPQRADGADQDQEMPRLLEDLGWLCLAVEGLLLWTDDERAAAGARDLLRRSGIFLAYARQMMNTNPQSVGDIRTQAQRHVREFSRLFTQLSEGR